MIHVKHFVCLLLLFTVLANIYAGKLVCPVHNIHHKHSFTAQISRSFQTIVGTSSAQLGEKLNFPVINFTSGATDTISAEVHRIGEIHDTKIYLWIEDSAYQDPQVNNLNSNSLTGESFAQIQFDRNNVISELFEVLQNKVVNQLTLSFGKIQDPQNARYEGLHFLLYDIKDSFEIDGTYVGGYFFPGDVDNLKMNILHMDINPLNPGGRETSPNISRKEFFHTLAHELFHLQHFHLIEGSSNWNSVAHWILEGFAQFAVYRVFQTGVFPNTQEAILDLPLEAPGQVKFYLEQPHNTYLFDFSGVDHPLPVEYYGLGYLFFSFLWEQLGSTDHQKDKIFKEFMTSNVNHTPRLRTKLNEYGISFEDIYEQFLLRQYFDNKPFDLEFINIHKDSKVGELSSVPRIDVSTLEPSTLANVRPYDVRYISINNDTQKYQNLQFQSECPSNNDPCTPCVTPRNFKVFILPIKAAVENCAVTTDPYSCILSGIYPTSVTEGTNLNITVPPGEFTLAFYSDSDEPPNSCSKALNRFSFIKKTEINQNHLPTYSVGPVTKVTNNKMEITFELDDPDSSSTYFSFMVKPKNTSSFFPTSSISTQASTLSVGVTHKLTWHFLEDLNSLQGSEIQFFLRDFEQDKLAIPFKRRIFAADKLTTVTSNITVYPGWNMLALQPQFGGQTVSQALEVLNQKIQLGDCIIGFDRGIFYKYSVDQAICEDNQDRLFFDRDLKYGEGFFVYQSSDSGELLTWNHITPSRWKYSLNRGWNLASLGLDVFPASNQISPTVPLALHYDTNSSDWQKIFMYGESPNIHIRDQQNFFPFQAHWIYSLSNRTFNFDN